mmetsp:Transcript_7231/g.18849  ORF Transcript_7231/g.18849 Transcript_7231/m.18849 type:complete len:246 (-) Transcript_7231:45-782(-)
MSTVRRGGSSPTTRNGSPERGEAVEVDGEGDGEPDEAGGEDEDEDVDDGGAARVDVGAVDVPELGEDEGGGDEHDDDEGAEEPRGFFVPGHVGEAAVFDVAEDEDDGDTDGEGGVGEDGDAGFEDVPAGEGAEEEIITGDVGQGDDEGFGGIVDGFVENEFVDDIQDLEDGTHGKGAVGHVDPLDARLAFHLGLVVADRSALAEGRVDPLPRGDGCGADDHDGQVDGIIDHPGRGQLLVERLCEK